MDMKFADICIHIGIKGHLDKGVLYLKLALQACEKAHKVEESHHSYVRRCMLPDIYTRRFGT